MNEDPQDEPLRRAFRGLRESDQSALPSLQRLLARASGPPPGRTAVHRPAWLAVAVALLAAGAVVLAVHRGSGRRPPPAAGDLVTWRSPTEGLLWTPGRELTSELPRVGRAEFAWLEAERP